MKIARWLALTVLAGALFSVAAPARAAAPVNDNYQNATTISSLPFSTTESTAGATDDGQYSSYCGESATVWFKFTPSNSGWIVAQTRGSNFDTVLAAFDAGPSGPGSGYLTGCNDDAQLQRSALRIQVSALHTYWFRVGGFLGATGGLVFNVNVGGTLAGVLRDQSSAPLTGSCVTLTNASGDSLYTTTSVTGLYALSGLPAGEYQPGPSCTDGGVRPWNPPALVAEGQTTQRDVVIDRAVIQGVVTAEQSGQPLGNVCVEAYPSDPNAPGFFTEMNTSPTGFYRLYVPPGSFDVAYFDCDIRQAYAPEYYNGAVDPASATAVSVTAGTTASNIDASLQKGGIVTGTVTDQLTHSAIQACIEVVRASDGRTLGFGYNWGSPTGYYAIGGFVAQPVQVRATDCYAETHADEWFNGSPTRAGSTTLSLSKGVTANAALALGDGSRINGVLSQDGGGAAHECITAFGNDGFSRTVGSSPTGYYSIPGLAAGPYKLRFGGCLSQASLAPEWYHDKSDYAGATTLTVPAGTVQTANASLAPEASLHAIAVDPATNKRAQLCYSATSSDGYFSSIDQVLSPTGDLRVGSLGTARYDVEARSCGGDALTGYSQDLGTFDFVAGSTTDLGRLNLKMQDLDGDGVTDHRDNCPLTRNADQADVNNDDLGNACDLLNPGTTSTKPPKLSVGDKTVNEGNQRNNIKVRVKLSAVSANDVTFLVKTASGTATANSDFVTVNQTFTIPAGATFVDVPITIKGDISVEPNETFTVTLSSPTNATISRGTATITLTNDD